MSNDDMQGILDRLLRENSNVREENAKLRAAIDRVRALHRHDEPCDVECSTWHDTTFCPTIRALDGENA